MSDVPPEIEKLREYSDFHDGAEPFVPLADAEAAVLACEQRMTTDWNAAILTLRSACCTPAGREQVERELVRPFGFDGGLRDEFDGEGCCPEEDGFLRAQAGNRIARETRQRTVAEIVEALRDFAGERRVVSVANAIAIHAAADLIEQRFGAKKEDS